MDTDVSLGLGRADRPPTVAKSLVSVLAEGMLIEAAVGLMGVACSEWLTYQAKT
jgi:hypothetical protein